ncbi:MAG: quercetin 2,3-dioxygenase [Tistrella sp.]|jgi:redox-sensitive bicupin YhaK (pirin superfamily)|uniref:Quercetin 2,3-dioxygenase n=1 Tax=Tistrella mobilis TaxID=171437 RepID=A0A3B9IUJ6_9PROT|nr:pirin family protein [Tistrella sp.]MAD36462.1 quercetin 2,3-dioxygenase [Tistrella sp.]MBA75568.1 quercetin 2,3-dioxygenase [Tistrella sp.]HAE50899.1 quercetin 2,3-dioxygenase [Tistrella mobilis]
MTATTTLTSSPRPADATTGRHVTQVVVGRAVSDGDGVKLKRVIGQPSLDMLDPFLMLDEFGSDDPGAYIGGFPAHPHRGFETVTYMLAGRMRHADNAGHKGVLVPGGVQWMSAGRGIIHEEMPEQTEGLMRGFQLWVNLPAAEKMARPAYREFGPESIPAAALPGDAGTVKVIAGEVFGTTGPVAGVASDPLYVDIELVPGGEVELPVPAGHTAFLYVYDGALIAGTGEAARPLGTARLAVLGGDGGLGLANASDQPARAILVAGRPIGEPVARYGPFVMNTEAEIIQAIEDYRRGRF